MSGTAIVGHPKPQDDDGAVIDDGDVGGCGGSGSGSGSGDNYTDDFYDKLTAYH